MKKLFFIILSIIVFTGCEKETETGNIHFALWYFTETTGPYHCELSDYAIFKEYVQINSYEDAIESFKYDKLNSIIGVSYSGDSYSRNLYPGEYYVLVATDSTFAREYSYQKKTIYPLDTTIFLMIIDI